MWRMTVFVIGVSLGLAFSVSACDARLLTVSIAAEVTDIEDPSSILKGEVVVGDVIRGRYTYDTLVPDLLVPQDRGSYECSSAPCGIVFQVGELVFQTDPNDVALAISIVNDGLGIADTFDLFHLESSRNLALEADVQVDSISLQFEDSGPVGEVVHPLPSLLSDALPASAPLLNEWPTRNLQVSGGMQRGPGFSIKGRLVSATGPEPTTVLYVDDDANGLDDGLSWQDAYRYLQDALTDMDTAEGPVEIRVAQGLYRPDQGEGCFLGDRAATFELSSQITLKGGYAGVSEIDPNARNTQAFETILTGDLNGDDLTGFRNREDNSLHVVSATDADETAVLDGFVIASGSTDSQADTQSVSRMSSTLANGPESSTICGAGLYIDGACPTVANCTFRYNHARDRGGGVYISGGPARIINCVFTSNSAGYAGGAIYDETGALIKGTLLQGNSAPSGGALFSVHEGVRWVLNCTFADNRAFEGAVIDCRDLAGVCYGPVVFNSIVCSTWEGQQDKAMFYYSDVVGRNLTHGGNIDEDPLFADPGYWDPNGTPDDPNDDIWVEGDYHLKSQAGRWDPISEGWVIDKVTSPCIDAGDPTSAFGDEPFPHGGRINMGAYGGTAEASKSYSGGPLSETIIAGDINGDCKVDITDLAIPMVNRGKKGRGKNGGGGDGDSHLLNGVTLSQNR